MIVQALPGEPNAGKIGLIVVVSLEDVLRLTARGEHFILDVKNGYGGVVPEYVQVAFHPDPPRLAADLVQRSSRVKVEEVRTPTELEALARRLQGEETPAPGEPSTLGMPLSHKDE